MRRGPRFLRPSTLLGLGGRRLGAGSVIGIIFLALTFSLIIAFIAAYNARTSAHVLFMERRLQEEALRSRELLRVYLVNNTETGLLDVVILNAWDRGSEIVYQLTVDGAGAVIDEGRVGWTLPPRVTMNLTLAQPDVGDFKVVTGLGNVFASSLPGLFMEAGPRGQTQTTSVGTTANATGTTVTSTYTVTTTVSTGTETTTATTTASATGTRTTTRRTTSTPALSLFLHTYPGDAERYVGVTGTFDGWGIYALTQGQGISEATDGEVEYEKLKRFTFEGWDVTWQLGSQSREEQVTSTTSPTVSFTATRNAGRYNAIAHFKREYYLSIGGDPRHGGEPTRSGWVEAFTYRTIEAGPFEFAYEVDTWFVDGEPVQTGGDTYTIYMDEPHSVVVQYKRISTTTTGTTTQPTTTTTQRTTTSTTTFKTPTILIEQSIPSPMQSTYPLIPIMLFAVATEAYRLTSWWRTSTERRIGTCQAQ